MCVGCWLDEPDNHVVVNSAVLEAARAVTTLYERHPTGGAMHIVVDDWNTDDGSVRACGDPSRDLDDVERVCHVAFSIISEPERQSALAIMKGWHTAQEAENIQAEHLTQWRLQVRAMS